MEALRDAGLEAACLDVASSADKIAHTFWLRSMAGEEIARTWAWGNDPERVGDYLAASPCGMTDFPQTRLEPILIAEATRLGGQLRFGWELDRFTQDADGVTAYVDDRLTGQKVTIRARYMIGADGARSRVVEQLGLPLVGQEGLGAVFNVFCEVDLSDQVAHRKASLFSVIQPGSSYWAPVAIWRMVRPWDQWLVGLIVPPAAGKPEPTQADFEARIRESAGIPDLPVKILSTSMWTINDIYAERYVAGRVFCMGDAVHRHPPTNGLGSNTCVQDAFNLAWKLALVIKGQAGPALLDSFEAERQPVGQQIVARANKSMGQNGKLWDMLGGGIHAEMPPEAHAAVFDTPEGRAQLRAEIDVMRYEYHAHGVELSRDYVSGAVVPDGTEAPPPARDPELYYEPSTRPGAPLPHAWLSRRSPSPLVSTLDLAGKGGFTLFIGPAGDGWRDTAVAAGEALGLDLKVVSIGPFLDREDPYGTWAKVCGVEEDGAVLVRPDLIVGWRAARRPQDAAAELTGALRQILARLEPAGR
jgi:2,4-dichlorophenol 6-monooxygenase